MLYNIIWYTKDFQNKLDNSIDAFLVDEFYCYWNGINDSNLNHSYYFSMSYISNENENRYQIIYILEENF